MAKRTSRPRKNPPKVVVQEWLHLRPVETVDERQPSIVTGHRVPNRNTAIVEMVENAQEAAGHSLSLLKLSKRDPSAYRQALSWWVAGHRALGQAMALSDLVSDSFPVTSWVEHEMKTMSDYYRLHVDPAFGLTED